MTQGLRGGQPRTVPAAQLRAVLVRFAVLACCWAGLVGLLIVAGEFVVHSAAVTHFDHHVTRTVVDSRTAALNSVMKSVTWLGSWAALLVAAVVIVVLVITGRRPVLAMVVAVVAWAGEAGGVRIAKTVVGRERPPRAIWLVTPHGWSFPSGHTAAACLAFTALAVCLATPARPRVVRVLCWLTAGLAVAVTGFSRVELGVHWTTDVIASILFMTGWLTAIAVVFGARLGRPEPVLDRRPDGVEVVDDPR
ncbi:MAG TPA: phosphatase PAP2 family protein [Streptosporangiaceae bacterium]|nr:phosphatase PAP2 family protein [Streptosporangiaceae bacterium]